MRIALASMVQETCSFTSRRTTLDDFRQRVLYEGHEILEKTRGTGALGGFLAQAEEVGHVEPVPIIMAYAGAGGTITDDTLAYFKQRFVAGLRQALPVDGVFLFLHGGAAAESEPDLEGSLLEAVREVVGSAVPVALALDHHASITQRIVDSVDTLVGHRTQPHDQYDTGVQTARLLFAQVQGKTRPTMAWHRIPLITHQEQFLTTQPGPMQEWFDRAREYERRPGVLSVSNFPMQPWLDVPAGGWANVVITDNDPALARRLSAELADMAWSMRDRFLKMDSVPPAEAIRRAAAAERGLVILSDTGDSVFGGAGGASTTLLREMLRQGITCTALVPIWDPAAAEIATRAGVGQQITLDVGAKADSAFYEPLQVTGRVAALASGRFEARVGNNITVDMGRTALLEVGSIRVMLSEHRGVSGNHPAVYRRLGIEPATAQMAVVKTASNWQYYADMISEVIRADTPGPTMSRMTEFAWRHLPRPIYPLDPELEWRAER